MAKHAPQSRHAPSAGILTDLSGRLAAALQRLRASRGWSQETAANQCGFPVYSYRLLETAKANFTAGSLARLAFGFDVDVVDLLQPAPPPKPRARGRPPQALDGLAASEPPTAMASPPVRRRPEDTPVVYRPPRDATNSPGVSEVVQAALDAQREQLLAEFAQMARLLVPDRPVDAPTPGSPGSTTSRLRRVEVVVPAERFRSVREGVIALLRANPTGLLARELAEAVRGLGHERLQANAVHFVLHDLYRRGHAVREGERGSFVYRLRPV